MWICAKCKEFKHAGQCFHQLVSRLLDGEYLVSTLAQEVDLRQDRNKMVEHKKKPSGRRAQQKKLKKRAEESRDAVTGKLNDQDEEDQKARDKEKLDLKKLNTVKTQELLAAVSHSHPSGPRALLTKSDCMMAPGLFNVC